MKSITIFCESLFNIKDNLYTRIKLNNHSNDPKVKEFIELLYRLLILEHLLSKEEKNRLKELYHSKEVQLYISDAKKNNNKLFHKIFNPIIGLTALGGIIGKFVFGSTLSFYYGIFALLVSILGEAAIPGKKDRYRISKELKKLEKYLTI